MPDSFRRHIREAATKKNTEECIFLNWKNKTLEMVGRVVSLFLRYHFESTEIFR